MARLDVMDLIFPAAVGAISAGGDIVEQNRKATLPAGAEANFLLDNSGGLADTVVGGFAIFNHIMPTPLIRQGSAEGMGAGVAILTRRIIGFAGKQVLGLTTGTPTKTTTTGRHLKSPSANHRLNAYEPAAALEVPPRSRKRQFFSVT